MEYYEFKKEDAYEFARAAGIQSKQRGDELQLLSCPYCRAEVYPNVCDELYCCIVIGMSYDKMNKKNFVPLDRKDFYAYRKKTLAVFREALKACNRYPF